MLSLLIACVIGSQPIMPLHTYNGVNNGIVIQVELPEETDVGYVLLLDHANNEIAPPAAVIEGTHDLIRRLPAIASVTTAAWVQLLIDDVPVGSPLVVQAMTSRKVPLVEESKIPNSDATYTKIVGWKDEAEEDGIAGPFVNGWRVYVDQNAIIETSQGDIQIALRPDVAPNTVWNFLELAQGGFYRQSTFHRIVPMTSKGHPFVIQGGDPTGTGSGGPGWWLPIEQSELQHDFGVISMARARDPDSAGSQFFICLSRAGTARLDGQYCAFGTTMRGDDVVRAIAAVPLADPSMGKPIVPPTIKGIHLIPAPPMHLLEAD